MPISIVFTAIYVIALLGLALYGFNTLVMSLLFLWHRRRGTLLPRPPKPEVWPQVTVQLPLFNERYVVERLIDAVAALDYPRDVQALFTVICYSDPGQRDSFIG